MLNKNSECLNSFTKSLERLEDALRRDEPESEDENDTDESFEFETSEVSITATKDEKSGPPSERDSIVNLTEEEEKLSNFLSINCKCVLTLAGRDISRFNSK